jgi:Ca2+-binding EF-hand superfamily protein
MKTSLRVFSLAGAGLLAAGAAIAQPGPGPGQGPRGERGQLMFQMLDVDRDGRITFAEAWGVVTERFNAADADRSGGLTPAEFAALRARAPDAPAPRQGSEERRAAMFRALDADRDGQVTLIEIRPMAEARFRAGDANNDGAVTRDEIRRHGRGDGQGRGPGQGQGQGPGAPSR